MIDLSELTDDALRARLRDRGFAVAAGARVEPLSGGVSGTVLRMMTADGPIVIKQALEELAVPSAWRADRRRSITEAEAMKTYARLTPGRVPELLDVDPESMIIVMSSAPPDWQPWKETLLTGEPLDHSLEVAAWLAETLATWHATTVDDHELLASFDDQETYRLLRTDPFYRALAEVHRDHAPRLGGLAEDLHAQPVCLVHGDFSPKNVLVGEDGQWVVDHEVAVGGQPVFDVAFLVAHLTLKALEPARRSLLEAARRFWSDYRRHWPATPVTDRTLADHVAVLMLARVDGVSRVNYLSEPERGWARNLALAQLADPAMITDLWDTIRTEKGDG